MQRQDAYFPVLVKEARKLPCQLTLFLEQPSGEGGAPGPQQSHACS